MFGLCLIVAIQVLLTKYEISLCVLFFLFSFFRIIMEADSSAVVQRVALRTDDIPLGEQTVAQV